MIDKQVEDYYERVAHQYDRQRFTRAYYHKVADNEVRHVLGKVREGSSVLEIGPGTGRFTVELVKKASHVTAIDVSESMLDQLRKRVVEQNLSTGIMNVYELASLPDYGKFDMVVCMRVLPHLEDPLHALKLIGQATKPGGTIIFDLWNENSFIGLYRKLLQRKSYVFTRYYSYSEMMDLISNSWLKVIDILAWGYPRIGVFSMEIIGNRFFKALGYSLIFHAYR